jgi:hypothetical protein
MVMPSEISAKRALGDMQRVLTQLMLEPFGNLHDGADQVVQRLRFFNRPQNPIDQVDQRRHHRFARG